MIRRLQAWPEVVRTRLLGLPKNRAGAPVNLGPGRRGSGKLRGGGNSRQTGSAGGGQVEGGVTGPAGKRF